MELAKRKIKKVSNEKIKEVAQIQYEVGDILKYYVNNGDKCIINYGKVAHIVNQDLYKVINISTNKIDKINNGDIIKKIDEIIFNDNISSIYYLLFAFLFLQTVGFLCYYLFTYHNKDLIIIGNIVISNIIVFVKNASTQLIVYKDKLISFI